MKLLLLTAIFWLTAASAVAQGVVPPGKVPKEWLDFQARPGERAMACAVTPVKPRLNFSFRFQTGFVAQFPGNQYVGKRHWIATFSVSRRRTRSTNPFTF